MTVCTLQDLYVTGYGNSHVSLSSSEDEKAGLRMTLLISIEDVQVLRASQYIDVSISGFVKSQIGVAWATQEIYSYRTGKIPSSDIKLQTRSLSGNTAEVVLHLKVPWSSGNGQSISTAVLVPSIRINGSTFVNTHAACNDSQKVDGMCALSNYAMISYYRAHETTPAHSSQAVLVVPSSILRRFRCVQPQDDTVSRQPLCFTGVANASFGLQKVFKKIWANSASLPEPVLKVDIPSIWESSESSFADVDDGLPGYEGNRINIPILTAVHYPSQPHQLQNQFIQPILTKRIQCKVVASWTAQRSIHVPNDSPDITSSHYTEQTAMIDFPPFCPPLLNQANETTNNPKQSYTTQSMITLAVPGFLSIPSLRTPLLSVRYRLDLAFKFKWDTVRQGREHFDTFTCHAKIPLSVGVGPRA